MHPTRSVFGHLQLLLPVSNDSLTSTQSHAAYVNRLTNLTDVLLLRASQGAANTVASMVISPLISVAVMKATAGSVSSVYNSSFSPPIVLKDATISIAMGAVGNGSSLSIAVMTLDSSLFHNSLNGSADGAPVLASDVLRIQVSSNDGTSSSSAPSFVATLNVEDEDGFVVPILQHNCTVGERSVRSLLCPESLVLMNITCSGLAAASVHRRCPVPKRVCNILNLNDLSVVSNNYCRAVSSSGGAITCECGLDKSAAGRNSSTELSGLLGDGGAVNLAVMTNYVAGDFGGTLVAGSASISANIAEQSVIVMVTFGLLWGFGLLNICIRHFEVDIALYAKTSSKTLYTNFTNSKIDTLTIQESKKGSSVTLLPATSDSVHQAMDNYLMSIVPSVYRPQSYWVRLRTQFETHYRSISLFSLFRTASKDDSHERKRRNAVLQLTYILTSVTVACFTMVLLYDIQYPVDDGSCKFHKDQVSCLSRRSLLDTSKSYCRWSEESTTMSPGWIQESSNGRILQTIPLESALKSQTDSAVYCIYDEHEGSGMVVLFVLVITMIVKVPLDFVLTIVFILLAAVNHQERDRIVQANLAASWAESDGQLSSSRSEVDLESPKSQRHRRGVMVAPMKDIADETIMVGESNMALFMRRRVFAPVSAAVVGCGRSWYDIYRVMVQTDPFPPFVPLTVQSARTLLMNTMSTSVPSFSTLSKDSRGGLILSGANEAQIHLLHTVWKFATPSEFGMTALQSLLVDILKWQVADSKNGNKEEAATIVDTVIRKEFPWQFYVQQGLQYALVGLLVMVNLGSLYYVLLKGMTRGYAWQRALLQVCFLDWFIQLSVHQTFEVWFVHFLIPNLVYEDVQRAVDVMRRMATRKCFRLHPVPGVSTNVAFVTTEAVRTFSRAKLIQQAWLESTMAFHLLSSDVPRRAIANTTGRGWILSTLVVIGTWPIVFQRAVSGLMSSALFSLLTAMWLVILPLPGPAASLISIALLLLALMLAIRYSFYLLRQYFLPSSTTSDEKKVASNDDNDDDDISVSGDDIASDEDDDGDDNEDELFISEGDVASDDELSSSDVGDSFSPSASSSWALSEYSTPSLREMDLHLELRDPHRLSPSQICSQSSELDVYYSDHDAHSELDRCHRLYSDPSPSIDVGIYNDRMIHGDHLKRRTVDENPGVFDFMPDMQDPISLLFPDHALESGFFSSSSSSATHHGEAEWHYMDLFECDEEQSCAIYSHHWHECSDFH